MRLFRGFFAKAGLAVASTLPMRPTPASSEPTVPTPEVDPASYLHVEVHVGAHRSTTRPATPEELAQAWEMAEAHWDQHYRDLPRELAAHTRRAMERRAVPV